jgi:hypothetical protein
MTATGPCCGYRHPDLCIYQNRGGELKDNQPG